MLQFPRTRTVGRVVATIAATSFALTACSSSDSATEDSGGETISITHAYGTTELEGIPERVVTLGSLESDIAVALGTEPVAMSQFAFSQNQVSPWLAEELTGTPELIDTTRIGASGADLNVERIAAAQPDLIIATTYADLDKYLPQLETIAPVLGPSQKDYLSIPWQDQVTSIAEALGRPEAGDELVEETTAHLDDAAARETGLRGLTYTLSLGTPDQIKVLQDPEDGSTEILSEFGLTLSPTAAALTGLGDGSNSAGVSEENLRDIDADLVFIAYFGNSQERWESSGVFQNLSAVRDGRYVPLDLTEITALRNPSPLSLPYAVDRIVVDKAATAVGNSTPS